MTERARRPFDPHRFAAELARQAGLPARLLDEHTDDGTGCCRLCSAGPTARRRHPCAIRELATNALALQGLQQLDAPRR